MDEINKEFIELYTCSRKYWGNYVECFRSDTNFVKYRNETNYYFVDPLLSGFASQIKNQEKIYDFDSFSLFLDHKYINWPTIKKYFLDSNNVEFIVPFLLLKNELHSLACDIYNK